MLLKNLKCYCGKEVSRKDTDHILSRMDYVASNLREGDSVTLTFRVDCRCGSNVIVEACVSYTEGFITKEIVRTY